MTSPDREEQFGLSCWKGRAEPMSGFHHHREIELNLVLSGELTYLIGGARLHVPAGSLALLWGAMPHRVIGVSGRAEVFWLTLPLDIFLRWNLPSMLLQAALQGHAVLDRETGSADQTRFESWADLLAAEQSAGDRNADHRMADQGRQIVLLELEARLRRLALLRPGDRGTTSGRAFARQEAGHVERMAAHIAEHYREPLRVSDLARLVGLHPNTASTLFRSLLGLGTVEYLTQYRIAHAQRLLMTSTLPVLDIMHEVGFRSTSRFHEAFRRACGCSPGTFRRQFSQQRG